VIGFSKKEDVSFDLKAFQARIFQELDELRKRIEKSLENKIE
jgi:hypothetical protein